MELIILGARYLTITKQLRGYLFLARVILEPLRIKELFAFWYKRRNQHSTGIFLRQLVVIRDNTNMLKQQLGTRYIKHATRKPAKVRTCTEMTTRAKMTSRADDNARILNKRFFFYTNQFSNKDTYSSRTNNSLIVKF